MFHSKNKTLELFQAIKYLERMLIQAYCQQEREKRCTITANSADSNSNSNSNENNESNAECTDTNESIDGKNDDDGTRTPKAEPNASPTPNDVEMIDATEPITAIKQEPEDEPMNVETDPLAEMAADESNTSKNADNDSQSESQSVKAEADENGNDSNKESGKDNQNDDEPIKIEESTADKDDPYSKDINIDPRTYCKLGHFHLLLEDYAKGKIHWQRTEIQSTLNSHEFE